jgi:hypothetical protein
VWGARVTLEDNFIEFLLAVGLISIFRFEKGLWGPNGAELVPGPAFVNLAGVLPAPAK